jgi:prepilin-type N-terminal cleavage/methylation domain-containing protein
MRVMEYLVRNEMQDRIQGGDCGGSTPNSELLTPHSQGFTLVEIVITIVLVTILSGIAAMIILQGVTAYTDEQSRSDVHYQARIAMERMAREIRVIRSAPDITTFTATNLHFTDVSGATLGFELLGTTLYRWNGASNEALATGINPFTFSYYQNDNTVAVLVSDVWFVDITMTSQQGTEILPMRTRVHPRNFY